MGRSRLKLSEREISGKSIFNNRMVVEVCEKIHFHYRNLRIVLSLNDFLELAKGLVSTLDRWDKLGRPEPQKGAHIELCRKKIANDAYNDGIQVNLNDNLYNPNKDRIYAEGADFEEKHYIHIKLRDLRIEMSLKEFEGFANAIAEAKGRLENSDTRALLSENRIHQKVH